MYVALCCKALLPARHLKTSMCVCINKLISILRKQFFFNLVMKSNSNQYYHSKSCVFFLCVNVILIVPVSSTVSGTVE